MVSRQPRITTDGTPGGKRIETKLDARLGQKHRGAGPQTLLNEAKQHGTSKLAPTTALGRCSLSTCWASGMAASSVLSVSARSASQS